MGEAEPNHFQKCPFHLQFKYLITYKQSGVHKNKEFVVKLNIKQIHRFSKSHSKLASPE